MNENNQPSASRVLKLAGFASVLLATVAGPATGFAQQSRESMANDATATQWSFQLAYQGMLNYNQDTLSSGAVRPEGNKGFLQFRMVAPIPVKGGAAGGGVTILPRLTIRYTQNQQDEWGLSPTDLFALIVPLEWSWGRAGIGPDIVIPGKEGFGSTEWQYGLATAVIMRGLDEKLTFGLLLQQVWGKTDPSRPGEVVAGNFIVNPFANYAMGKGFYLATNDLQSQYNWDTKGLLVPIGLRFGYLLIKPKYTFNFYAEYATSVYNDNWVAPAVKDQVRLNVSYQIPVGL
ncbi:MAG: hypothetical protein AMS21_04225 [Gemmatimonas sp. SG8_38_2]|nr:MAG: hypothetical protein AMS21_04225 [Gemmatimonas sp. SG8_38_2]